MNRTTEAADLDAKSEASTSTVMSDADWAAIEEDEIIMDEVSDAIDEVSKATEMGDDDDHDKDFDGEANRTAKERFTTIISLCCLADQCMKKLAASNHDEEEDNNVSGVDRESRWANLAYLQTTKDCKLRDYVTMLCCLRNMNESSDVFRKDIVGFLKCKDRSDPVWKERCADSPMVFMDLVRYNVNYSNAKTKTYSSVYLNHLKSRTICTMVLETAFHKVSSILSP